EASAVPSLDNLTTKSDDSASNDQKTVDLGIEKKINNRTFIVPLKNSEKTVGSRVPLSEDALYDAKHRLEALDAKDAKMRRNSELKNDLEAYKATSMKPEKRFESCLLDYLDELQTVSSSEQRQTFTEKLDEVLSITHTYKIDCTLMVTMLHLLIFKNV
ncbi:heat shock 70 kDa protein 17-like protein, partial [Tanacetum coccineum]